jgi:DNA (cytosine-5)-methyltransferase 1
MTAADYFPVLDAFSCKGSGAAGYIGAGAHCTGVDVVDYSDEYPGTFVQGDAVAFIREHGHRFRLIHISAPCQPRTRGNAARRNEHGIAKGWEASANLIADSREAAIAAGVPYVIENVTDAAPDLRDPILLCGRMFGLGAVDTHPDATGMELILERHRLFEFGNMPRPAQPAHPKDLRVSGIGLRDLRPGEREWNALLAASGEGRYLTGAPHVAGVYGGARRDPWLAKYVRHGGYVPADIAVLQQLLGVTHITTEHELFEAIPPAYTRWVLDAVRTAGL